MKVIELLVFKVCFILSLLIFSSLAIFAQQGASPVELSLDRVELLLPCSPGNKTHLVECSNGLTVKIETKVNHQTIETLNYNYQVTGGKILGTGSKVNWNLDSLQPGTYKISVSVHDGSGEVKGDASRIINVRACSDCGGDCFCHAQLGVATNVTQVTEGKTVVFSATSNVEATYQWSVYGGKIIKGRGKQSITVRALSVKKYNNVIATVRSAFRPELVCPDCSSSLEATAAVILEPTPKTRKH